MEGTSKVKFLNAPTRINQTKLGQCLIQNRPLGVETGQYPLFAYIPYRHVEPDVL